MPDSIEPNQTVLLTVTDGIVEAVTKLIEQYSHYISSYIHVLNKFISHLRRVATLRFERTLLIKFVKKLRFFNDSLLSYDISQLYEYTDLSLATQQLVSHFVKLLESFDLLNFFITQSLQKEIISKTLNSDLTLSDESIVAMDDTYNHFVKCTQWMVESLNGYNPLFDLEVVNFALKCAEEDKTDLVSSDNIFLHDIILVENESQYTEVALEWVDVLVTKVTNLETEFDKLADKWHEKFGKK